MILFSKCMTINRIYCTEVKNVNNLNENYYVECKMLERSLTVSVQMV